MSSNYITLEYVKKKITVSDLNLFGNNDGSGNLNDGYITDIVDDANNFVDSYLSGVYEIPISPVPEILVRITFDIFYYRILSARHSYKVPEEITKQYERSLTLLGEMQRGKFLSKAEPTGKTKPGSIVSSKEGESKYFTKDLLSKMP